MAYAHVTKTEAALRVLRERIQDGTLRPGERINVEALQQELQMSPTPIREALRLLQADGLIDYQPHRFVSVAETPRDVIGEVYRLRTMLEPFAVELAVPRLDADALRRLETTHTRFLEAAPHADASDVAEMNYAWHWEIYSAADSPLLLEFIARLWKSTPWRTSSAAPGWEELAPAQHDAVMAAIRVGDAATAAERMREHIASGREFRITTEAE